MPKRRNTSNKNAARKNHRRGIKKPKIGSPLKYKGEGTIEAVLNTYELNLIRDIQIKHNLVEEE